MLRHSHLQLLSDMKRIKPNALQTVQETRKARGTSSTDQLDESSEELEEMSEELSESDND